MVRHSSNTRVGPRYGPRPCQGDRCCTSGLFSSLIDPSGHGVSIPDPAEPLVGCVQLASQKLKVYGRDALAGVQHKPDQIDQAVKLSV